MGRPRSSAEPSITPRAPPRALAERRVVAAFGGDCTLPLAAWARPETGGPAPHRPPGHSRRPHAARGEAVGADPAEVAAACVAALREDGADEVLARIRRGSDWTRRKPPWERRRPAGFLLSLSGRRDAGAPRGGTVRALAGLRVVVTRAEHQADGLVAAFEQAGATVELLPLLEVVPPADPRPLERAATELALYDWVVFTSANAVEAFLPLTGGSLPSPAADRRGGSRHRRSPPCLGDRAEPGSPEGGRRGARRRPGPLRRPPAPRPPPPGRRRPADLIGKGSLQPAPRPSPWWPTTSASPQDAPRRAEELFAHAPLGWVTFTSPRIVRHFAELFGADWERRRAELRAASIGPVTSAELRRQGVEPAAEAGGPGTRGWWRRWRGRKPRERRRRRPTNLS